VDVDTPGTAFLDLSKATKLKHLTFLRASMRSPVPWITVTLKTVESKHLQSITICLDSNVLEMVGASACRGWNDLDRLLVQFWTSHSISPQVMYPVGNGGKGLRGVVPRLLPELTRRGLVDLVEASS